MPIITKPALIEKGVAAEFSLDKAALALHPIVVADPYFSSPNNWGKVDLKYKSDEGGQFEIVEFNATVASPTGNFFVSETAKDVFEVEKITIIDHDGGILVIPRAELTVAEFDIDFAAPPSSEITFDGRNSATYISFPEPGKVVRLLPSGNLENSGLGAYWSTQSITGDFTFTATVKTGLSNESVIQALFGLNTTIPVGGYALAGGGWGLTFDHGSRTVQPWGAASNSLSWTAGSTYNIEIKRVNGVVSYKVDNTTFTYTLSTSATLYVVGYLQIGSWEVSNASLVIPEAPAVQTLTWNTAGKTGVGSVTTGANGLITRSDAGGSYNLNVLSNEIITGDGHVEFVVSADFVSVVFGLAEVNSPTGSFNNLLLGCYRTANPSALEGVVTTGNLTVNYGNFLNIGTAQVGDIIKIERVGTAYSIKINNGSPYSVTINNTNPVKASISPYYNNTGVNNVTISL